MILGTPEDAVTHEVRSTFRKKAERILDAGAVAFGEMAALHFSFNPHHPFLEVAADHPLFLLLADIAGEKGVPIDLHMEAVVQPRDLPVLIRRQSSANPASLPATIPALERLLAHNRRTRIVWQHAGWDNTGERTVALMRDLLKKHENLFLALKFVDSKYEQFRSDGTPLVDADGRLTKEWEDLIAAYPDRFVIGADEFVAASGKRPGPPSLASSWRVVSDLPESLRLKVTRDNAARIYGL